MSDVGRRRSYFAEVTPDETTDGETIFLAKHPELPGCMAHGDTPAEALENLDDARELYIADLRRRGTPIPEPQGVGTVVVWESFGVIDWATDVDVLATTTTSDAEEPPAAVGGEIVSRGVVLA